MCSTFIRLLPPLFAVSVDKNQYTAITAGNREILPIRWCYRKQNFQWLHFLCIFLKLNYDIKYRASQFNLYFEIDQRDQNIAQAAVSDSKNFFKAPNYAYRSQTHEKNDRESFLSSFSKKINAKSMYKKNILPKISTMQSL